MPYEGQATDHTTEQYGWTFPHNRQRDVRTLFHFFHFDNTSLCGDWQLPPMPIMEPDIDDHLKCLKCATLADDLTF